MATGKIPKYANGNDTGWKEYVNENIFSGTIYYRKIGNIVNLVFEGLKLINESTSGNIDLGSIPASAGITPYKLTTFPVRIYTTGTTNYTCAGTVFASGNQNAFVRIYKDPSISTVPVTATINGNATYII